MKEEYQNNILVLEEAIYDLAARQGICYTKSRENTIKGLMSIRDNYRRNLDELIKEEEK
jgi:hypothetical protein